MSKRSARSTKLDNRFFDAIASGQTITAAAQAAGCGRRTVYDRRAADEAFRERWDEAVEIAIERMEAEADRRAIEGTLVPVFYEGAECGEIRKFSDTLLIFRLKALKPERYRERFEHTAKSGESLIPRETDSGRLALAVLNILNEARKKPDGA